MDLCGSPQLHLQCRADSRNHFFGWEVLNENMLIRS